MYRGRNDESLRHIALPIHYSQPNVVSTSTYEIAARYAAACASSAVR
jgi:hypothetical protein